MICRYRKTNEPERPTTTLYVVRDSEGRIAEASTTSHDDAVKRWGERELHLLVPPAEEARLTPIYQALYCTANDQPAPLDVQRTGAAAGWTLDTVEVP